jgi:Cu2+-exporting ATPase
MSSAEHTRPMHDMTAHGVHGRHETQNAQAHARHDHGEMVEQFKRRFWTSLLLTLPVLMSDSQTPPDW